MAVVEANDAAIREAAGYLKRGGLVAFPTETVYGLGADATDSRAVAHIFETKGRPRFNPLIVHVVSLEAAERFVEVTGLARRLAEAFWPGPLTLVLKRKTGVEQPHRISDLVTAGLDTVAVRVPGHAIARRLLEETGLPLAAPSANRSGRVSPTLASHVEADFGLSLPIILDGGATVHGLESTVLDVSGDEPRLLRPGAVPREAIEAVLGRALAEAVVDTAKPSSPGQLESHYAPHAAIRLNAFDVRPGEALLGFGPAPPATSGPSINLSATGDLVEAATRLFAALRDLDQPGTRTIAVMTIPDTGLGEAINDRLMRAAAPRALTS
jgi:L-threonylcarbamoyladenylate synthase